MESPRRRRWAQVYTLILIYFIYFEEFIVNLSAFEALMPFLWMLKNVNIELFSSPLFFLFNLHSRSKREHTMAGISQHFCDYIVYKLYGSSKLDRITAFDVCLPAFSIYPAYQWHFIWFNTFPAVAFHIHSPLLRFTFVHRIKL